MSEKTKTDKKSDFYGWVDRPITEVLKMAEQATRKQLDRHGLSDDAVERVIQIFKEEGNVALLQPALLDGLITPSEARMVVSHALKERTSS